MPFCAAAGIAIWALLNMVLLSQLRNPPIPVAKAGGEPATPAGKMPPHPVQFSLRSMFVFSVILALACWLGTRPLPPDDSWGWFQSGSSSNGNVVAWSVEVVGYRSGTPVAGYLWRSEGKKEARSPSRVSVAHDGQRRDLIVDGSQVRPTHEFQLFVNDCDDNPMRLTIPKKDATELFGRNLDMPRLEKFWQDTVEPQRKRQAEKRKSG